MYYVYIFQTVVWKFIFNGDFWWTEIINLHEDWLSKFFLCWLLFSPSLRNDCLSKGCDSLISSLLKVLCFFFVFMFRSVIHIKLILWMVWSRGVEIHFFPQKSRCSSSICSKTFISPLEWHGAFVENQLVYICVLACFLVLYSVPLICF